VLDADGSARVAERRVVSRHVSSRFKARAAAANRRPKWRVRALGGRGTGIANGRDMRAALLSVCFAVAVALGCRPDATRRIKASKETVAEVDALVHRTSAVRWTTAATLLGDGEESCIDGRSASPVLGSPGGDVGEMMTALGALERAAGAPLSLEPIDKVFDEYAASFGHVYFHTDTHALERLGAAIHADTRFSGVRAEHPSDVHDFVLAPPAHLRGPLLELLVRPEHIGCGHLRLTVEASERYHLRPELARAVIAGAFRLAWRSPSSVDYVVLEGDHKEKAIVEVHTERAVHASSRVPMLAPYEGAARVFVRHPEVAAFVRRENALFFLERAPTLVAHAPAEARYLREIDELADHHARETLERLAHGLPTVSVHVHGSELVVDP
jgi:hypothetical protein